MRKTIKAPWTLRGVGGYPLAPGSPVRWVEMEDIRPDHGRPTRPDKPVDPSNPYPPLAVDSRMVLQDGYHRYYELLDAGYAGPVPIVTIDV